jgi:ATP-dependent Clp protease ATP-binding subunit ClpA
VLELSLREALRLGHNSIGSEHILLGLMREGEGLAAKIMAEAGINVDDLRHRTETALRSAA